MAIYHGHQEDENGNILLPTPHSLVDDNKIQLSSVASRAYAKGEYLVFNNNLCSATSAIAMGATLAIGTNLKIETVGDHVQTIEDNISSLNAAIGVETDAREAADIVINSRIDNIIAPSGEAPNPAEIIDARLGNYGKTYASLGASIRSQIRDLSYKGVNNLNSSYFEKGSLNNGKKDSFNEDSRIRTQMLKFDIDIVVIRDTTNYSAARWVINYCDGFGDFVSNSGWISEKYFIIPKGTIGVLMFTLTPYSNTSKTIEEILEAFSFVPLYQDDKNLAIDYMFGGYDSVTGKYSPYYYYGRACTINIQKYDHAIAIVPTTTGHAAHAIFYYDESGNYLNQTGWIISPRISIVPANTPFKMMLSKIYYAEGDSSATLADHVDCFRIIPIENENDAKSDVIKNNMKNLFARGTFVFTNPVDTRYDLFRADYRICTYRLVKCSKDIFIRRNSGYYCVSLYDDNEAVTQTFDWIVRDFFIPANTYFAMTISPDYNKSSGDAYTIDEMLGCVTIEIAENVVACLDPNVILQCRNVDDLRYPPYSKWYIQAANKNQYDRVRVNIRKTTDGKYVLIHDTTINSEARNTDGSYIETSIDSFGQTLATLNAYDWGIKYGSIYAGYKVPLLTDAAKFAANYNMGLTIETSENMLNNNIDDIFDILKVYGLIDKLIVITSTGSNFSEMQYWKSKNKYISYFVGGQPDFIERYTSNINDLKTGYNSIYIMPYPFGSVADEALMSLALSNDWKLYNSSAMSKDQLFNLVGFNSGNSLIEANNVYMIKNTVQQHADQMVETP